MNVLTQYIHYHKKLVYRCFLILPVHLTAFIGKFLLVQVSNVVAGHTQCHWVKQAACMRPRHYTNMSNYSALQYKQSLHQCTANYIRHLSYYGKHVRWSVSVHVNASNEQLWRKLKLRIFNYISAPQQKKNMHTTSVCKQAVGTNHFSNTQYIQVVNSQHSDTSYITKSTYKQHTFRWENRKHPEWKPPSRPEMTAAVIPHLRFPAFSIAIHQLTA